MKEISVIVLAGGKGTRLGLEEPKVLVPILGRPIISYLLDTLRSAELEDITIVVGYKSAEVRKAMGESYKYVFQPEQKGSGHAVLCAKESLKGKSEHVLVFCGDSPLFRRETVEKLIEHHKKAGAVVTLTAAEPADPTGYGRLVRSSEGRIIEIVEENCADEQQKSIKEVNGGAYAFRAEWLWANINRMQINAVGELNLTGMVNIAAKGGEKVEAIICNEHEILGINTPEQLRIVEAILMKSVSKSKS